MSFMSIFYLYWICFYENQMDLNQQPMEYVHLWMFVMQLKQSCCYMRTERLKGDTYVHHMRLEHRIWCKSIRVFILIPITPKAKRSYMKSRNELNVPTIHIPHNYEDSRMANRGPLINNSISRAGKDFLAVFQWKYETNKIYDILFSVCWLSGVN